LVPFSDRIVFSTDSVAVGAFRCGVSHPQFRTEGPIDHQSIVFPRSAVWIQHAGQRPFVADPRVITIYNLGQEYVRDVLSPEGDRSDWFGATPAVARGIVREIDPGAADLDRPFRVANAPSDPRLYLEQRHLFVRLDRGELEPLEAEQAILELMARVIRRAHGSACAERRLGRRARDAHRDLADAARAELARSVAFPVRLSSIAARLKVSPFHLCRVFREQTGSTLHEYRLDVRLRFALERVAESRANLSQLALDLGFSSHSHFTWALRRWMSVTPSAVRRLLSPFAEASRARASA
jgi:AraC-like DNA-binding protein